MESPNIIRKGETVSMDPTASGFAHGFGIFETIKLMQGQLCFWKEHWERLKTSAQVFGFSNSVQEAQVLSGISSLVRDEEVADGTVKVSLLDSGGGRSKIYLYTRPKTTYANTASLWLDSSHLLNPYSAVSGHKTHNYMENMLLLQLAKSVGFSEVLRLNTLGQVAETTGGNFFFFKGDRLCTPAVDTGILPGVVRGKVIKLAAALGLSVEEGHYDSDALGEMEAAIVTNSSVGLWPVSQLKGDGIEKTMASESYCAVLSLQKAFAAEEAACAVEI